MAVILEEQFLNSSYRIHVVAWALVKLLSESHWTNVGPDLCSHLPSLGHSELRIRWLSVRQWYLQYISNKDTKVTNKKGWFSNSFYTIQCTPDISQSCVSRNWIYRGRMLDPIFFGVQERDIFREIAVTPWTQFAGDNFSRNLLTAIAFVLGQQEKFFAKPTLAYLSMRAGTHALRWSATPGGALTPPLCRRVGSS